MENQELTTPVEGVETQAEADTSVEETGEQATQDDEQESESQAEKKKYRVKVGGEELEVDEDELLAGYSRNADATRKWQEAAELRKAAEAERTRFMQMNQQQAQAYQAVIGLDAQLQQFAGINWQQLSDSDPAQAQKLYFQYQQLKEQRGHVANQLSQIEQAKALEQQQLLQKQVEEGHRVLEREIPNWSQETAKSVRTFAEKELGFTAQELSQIYDPRVVRLLHAAMVGNQLAAKAKQAQPQQQAQPVPKVSGNSSGPRDINRMSVDDWMKARNAELRKRRA